jgi:AmiR/NasT family two-component response regulator
MRMSEVVRHAEKLRVLIVEDETIIGIGLRGQLTKLGHTVVGQAADAQEARAKFKAEEPDLVMMDIRLGDDDGLKLAVELLAQRRVPMIVLSAFSDQELINRASDAGVFGYLIKPASPEALAAQIEVAVGRFGEQEQLRSDKQQLTQALETRKLMDKSKGILMKRLHLDESQAHRWLQTESQKRRIGLAELAKRVIDSEELLGEP